MHEGPQPDRKSHDNTHLTGAGWQERQRSRERRKIIGLLVIVLFIVVLAFFRFGRTIPWGAR